MHYLLTSNQISLKSEKLSVDGRTYGWTFQSPSNVITSTRRSRPNGAGDDAVAVASVGPCADHLHLAPDRQPCQHLIAHFFTGRILFLTPNQQRQRTKDSQRTEGTHTH